MCEDGNKRWIPSGVSPLAATVTGRVLTLLVFVKTLRRFGGLIDHIQLKHPLSVTDGPHISLFTSEGLHSS